MVVRGPASKVSLEQAEERLLVEAAQKDPSRFGELYENNFERVYAFIARRVRDRDVVEDLTSDVFHKALTNLGRFEWRGVPFAAWLFRIAANVIVDRSSRAAKELSSIDDPAEPPSDTGPEEIENRAQLFRLVDRLPAGQRRAIVMRFASRKVSAKSPMSSSAPRAL